MTVDAAYAAAQKTMAEAVEKTTDAMAILLSIQPLEDLIADDMWQSVAKAHFLAQDAVRALKSAREGRRNRHG